MSRQYLPFDDGAERVRRHGKSSGRGGRVARLLTSADGEAFDYIVGMDGENMRHMRRILGGCRAKVCLLLDGTAHPRPIADPWYTGDFDETYRDVTEGCTALLHALTEGK